MQASPAGGVCHIRTIPVAATVTPYTAVPSVRYSASAGGGAAVESMGTPRELNMMQAVLSMLVPASSVHGGA